MGEGRAVARSIDTHTHLNHPRLISRLRQVLESARTAGVAEMIVVGYDVPSSELGVELAEQHAGLWAAVGVHPHDARTVDGETVARLRSLARADRVAAMGETGLDFYRDLSPREAQVEAFRRHLALAEEMSLPLIAHCRDKVGRWDAQELLLSTVTERPGVPVVWHCFEGLREHAAQAVRLGLVLGFGGMLTYRRAEELRQIAAEVPADRVLLETDCPYLAPEPRRWRDNEPANLPITAECLAEVRGESREQVAALTTENARRVFRLRRKAADG